MRCLYSMLWAILWVVSGASAGWTYGNLPVGGVQWICAVFATINVLMAMYLRSDIEER